MTALALSSPGCDGALPSQPPDRSPMPYRKCSDGASVPFSSSGAEDRSDEEEYDITTFKRERMFDILLWKYDDDPARQFEDERGFESLNLEERLDEVGGSDEAHVSWNAAPRRKKSMSRKMRDMRAASDSFGGDIAAAVEKRRERARGARMTERSGRAGEGQGEATVIVGDAAVGDAEHPAEADSVEKSRDGEGGAHLKAAKENKKKVGSRTSCRPKNRGGRNGVP